MSGLRDVSVKPKGTACSTLDFIFQEGSAALHIRKGMPPEVVARYLRDFADKLEAI